MPSRAHDLPLALRQGGARTGAAEGERWLRPRDGSSGAKTLALTVVRGRWPALHLGGRGRSSATWHGRIASHNESGLHRARRPPRATSTSICTQARSHPCTARTDVGHPWTRRRCTRRGSGRGRSRQRQPQHLGKACQGSDGLRQGCHHRRIHDEWREYHPSVGEGSHRGPSKTEVTRRVASRQEAATSPPEPAPRETRLTRQPGFAALLTRR